ncbi:hypothetical protein [Capnocytophaga felis]|uniref:hypothetical protein n=1 Tax=Capnocytophaga felis TaxID=2267611 RepID=UPI0012D2AB1E|nr:hypothetical protein [Capnocytophaga felis]
MRSDVKKYDVEKQVIFVRLSEVEASSLKGFDFAQPNNQNFIIQVVFNVNN